MAGRYRQKYKRDDQFITHNFDFEWHDYSYGMQPEVNQYEAAKCMDIAGCDIYHPSQSSLSGREITACGNIARGIKVIIIWYLRPRQPEITHGFLIRDNCACRP